jgi:hypothetical protein
MRDALIAGMMLGFVPGGGLGIALGIWSERLEAGRRRAAAERARVQRMRVVADVRPSLPTVPIDYKSYRRYNS